MQFYVRISLAAYNCQTWYDTYLGQDLSMHGTIAPGSCPWVGLGLKIYNRSPRKHTKMWLKISLWYHLWGWFWIGVGLLGGAKHRFKFTCKFRCNFTSAFLLQLITVIPYGLESWNLVWYLPRARPFNTWYHCPRVMPMGGARGQNI